MVFDVESVGLHGEGFAVGWVVIDGRGREMHSAHYGCAPSRADGAADDLEWVEANCHTLKNCQTPRQVRDEFWRAWEFAKKRGVMLAAEVPWPVEARFLSDCIKDDPTRKWEGPYPLIDVASAVLSQGGDPMVTRERLPSELPAHNPLADARQSARLFIEAIGCPEGVA